MKVIRQPDAAAFLAAAGAFLAEREALHNLPLAIAAQCLADPTRYPQRNYFAVVENGDRVAGVALMTVPYRLQYYAPPTAAAVVAADLHAGGFRVPGVHGPEEAATTFAARWCAPRGLEARRDKSLRAFELSEVRDPPAPPGRARRAGSGDEAIVAEFYRGFHADTGAAHGSSTPEELGLRALRQGRVRLWDDGGPVCQAVEGGSTPNGRRVGGVFTPPQARRRGYATALVAALSHELLDAGARYCFLFTDLANPISNSIYPKVGYRPVADFAEIDFV